MVSQGAELASIDDLLSALEGASGTTARLVDLPPLELAGLRASFTEAALERFRAAEAEAARRPLPGPLAHGRTRATVVARGVGRHELAFFVSARHVGSEHVVVPYREDWEPFELRALSRYARRISGPYRAAMTGHFDPTRETWTERAMNRNRR